MTTGFAYDARFLQHHAGPHHPERPERVRACLAALARTPWFADLPRYAPAPAPMTWIETCHASAYLERAARACASGEVILDTVDVGISVHSYEIARLAAGAPMALADAIVAGEITNGFALVRPPGHHAERDHAMGFCLLNNVAIVTRYLQRHHGLDKIAIVDWDVHHGNGTQHTFEEDPSVLYVSLHQYPYYPGTGAVAETGIGRGRGTTLNCPMAAGSGDTEYERAFVERIIPAIATFQPEAVIISAGFDAHHDDPLADIHLTTGFFGWMTARIVELSGAHAGGRTISVLEGGYDLEALAACVVLHLEVLHSAGAPRAQSR